MIDIQVKIHDKFSVEFKTGFYVRHDERKNNFAVNMWIFVPNSLDINAETYSKNQFYRDMKSNVRLITPIFLLRDIAGGMSVPLKNLQDSFERLAAAAADKESVAEYEYQIKMFMAIFKSSVRDEMVHILSSTPLEDIPLRCGNYVQNIEDITRSYRQLRHIISIPTVPAAIFNYFLFGDEFMGHIIERHTFRLISRLEKRYGDSIGECTQQLRALIHRENTYQKERCYPVADKKSPNKNREIVFRQGVLKKYIESDLFLRAKKKRDGVVVEQLYLSLAAGISMIFATAIAFSFQQRYGNFTMPLFVALVVSYMLKDRIKDTMRYFFAHRLGSKYFDNKTLVGIKEKPIGWIKEGVDFITDEKTPAQVMELRSRSPLLEAENRISDEKIILYRTMVNLDGTALRNDDCSDYVLAGINEISRLHLTGFLHKMDNAEVPLQILEDDGRISEIMGDKVYYLNVVVQLQHEEQLEYKHFRLIFNREGIIKIEEFK